MKNLIEIIPGASNFTYGEMIHSDTAIKNNIDNIPNDNQWENLENLAINILQPLRNQFGAIKLHCAYRSPEVNKKVGGSPTSNHILGQAADLTPSNSSIKLIDMVVWIHNNVPYHELIAEYFDLPTAWIHVAYDKNNNNKVLKLKDNIHNYTKVKIEELKSLYK